MKRKYRVRQVGNIFIPEVYSGWIFKSWSPWCTGFGGDEGCGSSVWYKTLEEAIEHIKRHTNTKNKSKEIYHEVNL